MDNYSYCSNAKIRRINQIAYVINDSCVSCGTCEGECPVGAIAAGDGKYEINPDTCVSCGTCAGVCPTGAISEGYLLFYEQ